MYLKLYVRQCIGLLFLFLFLAIPSQAQEFTQEARSVCLDMKYCIEEGVCNETHGHRVRLSSRADLKPFPSEPKTYITECVMHIPYGQTTPMPVCTTGSSVLDKELFCGNDPEADCNSDRGDGILKYDKFSQMQKDIGYSLNPGDNSGIYVYNGVTFAKTGPILVGTDSLGNIPTMEWQSYTPEGHERKWLAWSLYTPQAEVSGSVGGQQQGTLTFTYSSSDCAGVAYDPYGRTFDAVSLEPIPNTKVELLQQKPEGGFDKDYATSINPNIVNPYSTSADGMFTFIVKDGDYKLQPVNLSGYEFMADTDTAKINTNYARIYSDIYFSNSPAIQQRGKIQHRDIPLYPVDGVGKQYPFVLMSQYEESRNDGTIIYEGKVSHPYAKMFVHICTDPASAVTCYRTDEYSSVKGNGGPDRDGNFKITINMQGLKNAHDSYRIEFDTVDLKDPSQTIGKVSIWNQVMAFFNNLTKFGEVQAETKNTVIIKQPIPLYVEGFAYDTEGNVMPNAIVGIYIAQIDKPVYQVKANKNGYFKITSEYLPKTPYSIKFNDGKKKSAATVSQFFAQNAEFVKAEKIDPYKTITKESDPRRNITPSFTPKKTISIVPTDKLYNNGGTGTNISNPPISGTGSPVGQQQANQPGYMLIVIVLLVLVGAVGAMFALYLYKKNSAPPTY